MFDIYSKMMERSFNQYINYTKILHNSMTTVIDFNLRASKNYMEWLTERRSSLMGLYLKSNTVFRPKSETRIDVNEKAPVIETEAIKTAEARPAAPKKRSKNALYQV